MRLEFYLYVFIFVVVGLMLVSCFLVWLWFDVNDRLKVVREVTREQTMHAIRHSHNRCRWLICVGLLLALAYVPLPFVLDEYYRTLVYPGIVILADTLILVGMSVKTKDALASIDDYVAENEEHVREAAAERARVRDEWKKQAPILNPQAEKIIKENLGNDFDVWYQHDILVGRDVLANVDLGLLYVQGVIIPIREIMEVRQGRKDLKLVTTNSMHPFITIDFGSLPINPETGNKYKDEIAAKIEKLIA